MSQKQLVSELTIDEFKKVIENAMAAEIHRLIQEATITVDGIKVSVLPDKEDKIPLKRDFETSLLRSIEEAQMSETISLEAFRQNHGILKCSQYTLPGKLKRISLRSNHP